jgi:hypothetical protein
MPLLEINQTATSALRFGWISLPPSTSISTPLSFTHPRMMLWTRHSTMSSRKTVISRTF